MFGQGQIRAFKKNELSCSGRNLLRVFPGGSSGGALGLPRDCLHGEDLRKAAGEGQLLWPDTGNIAFVGASEMSPALGISFAAHFT